MPTESEKLSEMGTVLGKCKGSKLKKYKKWTSNSRRNWKVCQTLINKKYVMVWGL